MDDRYDLRSIEEAVQILNSDRNGLTEPEAKSRLLQYGPNKLDTTKGLSSCIVMLRQFRSPLILILLVASIVKLLTLNLAEGLVLFITVLLMAVIGFYQEAKAEKMMKALKDLTSHKCKVKREGKTRIIISEHLVPGDLMVLEAGDKIPADGRLISSQNLKMDESMLTGESLPVLKQTETLEKDLTLADRKNMVYAGTIVVMGRAYALVTHTAMATELGKITSSLRAIKPEPTPLQKSLNSIGHWMLLVILCAIFLFALISFFKGFSLTDIFFLGIAAAISAIPEGLPIAFTTTLANGMHIMARRNAIIRKLIAAETLGSISTICCDKTGTLTLNRMRVVTIYSLEKQSATGSINGDPIFSKILKIGALCNDASFSKVGHRLDIIGDPTEAALLYAAHEAGVDPKQQTACTPRIGEIPFQSENLYMATLHICENKRVIFIKGAPEKVLSMSCQVLTSQGIQPLDPEKRQQIEQAIESMTLKSLRLIAVAYCEDIHSVDESLFKGRLVFAGILGMTDPPRKEAIEAVLSCQKAGIQVVMITGDNPNTASVIAKELKILNPEVITGKQLESMSDASLQAKLRHTAVFARVEPMQKLRIVRSFQALGNVVAMTGDGINDAPALEAANIGIAMGTSGTDVAKEAADMILTDDRFDTIVVAVEEGRAIYNRLRNICAFFLSTCLGELLSLVLSVLIIGMAPLTPLQILWINLISGSLLAIPLGFEPKTGNEMQLPPRSPGSNFLYKGMIYRIAFIASLLGVGAFLIFNESLRITSIERARTIVLTSIVIFEWLIAIALRSEEIPLHKIGIFSNKSLLLSIGLALISHIMILYVPVLRTLFATEPLQPQDWLIALIPGVTIFFVEHVRKLCLPRLFSRGRF